MDTAAKPIRRDQLAALLARFALEAPGPAEANAVVGVDPAALMRAARTLSSTLRLIDAATAFVGCLDTLRRIPRGRGASDRRLWA